MREKRRGEVPGLEEVDAAGQRFGTRHIDAAWLGHDHRPDRHDGHVDHTAGDGTISTAVFIQCTLRTDVTDATAGNELLDLELAS